MTVTMGTPLFRINGLGSVWVNAEGLGSRRRRCAGHAGDGAHAVSARHGVFMADVMACCPR